MSRPIAGTNKYPFGECGFVVDGALLRDGTKLRNLRIYKQRSDVMYDLVDPTTDVIYQKMLITGIDTSGYVLNYADSNDQILNQIQPNTFFVRGYNDSMTREGFIVKFLLNKVILSSSRPMFDVYTPECHMPLPIIANVMIDTVREGDTAITGKVSSPGLDTTGMVVEVTIDGVVYSTTVNPDGTFSISPLPALEVGTYDLVVKSDYYQEYVTTVPVRKEDEDSDYVTSFNINPVLLGDVYSAVIPVADHQRGTDLVLQSYKDGELITLGLAVNAGDITVLSSEPGPFDIVIIGKTDQTVPFTKDVSFDGVSPITIPKSEHNKDNPSFTVYENGVVIGLDVEIDDSDNITFSTIDAFDAKIVITGK